MKTFKNLLVGMPLKQIIHFGIFQAVILYLFS